MKRSKQGVSQKYNFLPLWIVETSFVGRSPPQHVFSNLVCSLILIILPVASFECCGLTKLFFWVNNYIKKKKRTKSLYESAYLSL